MNARSFAATRGSLLACVKVSALSEEGDLCANAGSRVMRRMIWMGRLYGDGPCVDKPST